MGKEFVSEKETATEKALKILECFIPYNAELGNADITALTGFHRATTSRIIKTLERHQFLYQNPQTRKYRLGNKIIDLYTSIAGSAKSNLFSVANDLVTELRNETGETIIFETLSEDNVVPTIVCRGKGPVFIEVPTGTSVPWNTSTGLKAILAFSNSTVKRLFFSKPMLTVGRTSITDLEQYKAALAEIRRLGYCLTTDEPVDGIASIAVPVFDYNNIPIAAISCAGVKVRIIDNKDSIVNHLQRTAKRVTENIQMKE